MRKCLALACLWAAACQGAETDARHQFEIAAGFDYAHADTSFEPWTDGGVGKLRYATDGTSGGRLLARYRGRISNTLWARAELDYDGQDGGTIGLTEIELAWRPVPTTRNRHRVRFGAIYPPFSLENGDVAWSSPFGLSFSAINSWLAEEIRPVGVEWQVSRRIGDPGSPHELSFFSSVFYGNDPAARLLFWRGWGIHDRQTRLNEHIAVPSLPIFDSSGNVTGMIERPLDPIHETDHRPGYYAGLEWRMGRRVLTRFGRYDNRADPESFSGGEWGWNTRFLSLSAQFTLPADIGLIAQWMDGSTDWLMFVTPTGLRTANTKYVSETFDSNFVLLTRPFGRHRLSVRRDRFGMHRGSELTVDEGRALTLSYGYSGSDRISVIAEYLRIESARDLWVLMYRLPREAVEKQLRLSIQFDFDPAH